MTKNKIFMKHATKFKGEYIMTEPSAMVAMEEYAQQQVKNLNIPAVSNNEVAVCPHKHIMWINSYWKYFCLECGKTGIESN